MPRRPAKLSNCYVPLPLPSSQDDITTADIANSASKTNKEDIAFRHDGRSAGHELRRLCLETSVITRALGSSLVELGHTKVLAEVHIAPAQIGGSNNKKRNSNSNEATNDIGCLKCHVKYVPHVAVDQVSQLSRSVTALDGSNKSGNSSSSAAARNNTASAGKLNQEFTLRESGLSRQLTAALLPVIILERYPKCAVVVTATVLQDDGSCLSAAITAASMALVDARVELRDVVTSCTVAVVDNANSVGCTSTDDEEDRWLYLADPTEREMTSSTIKDSTKAPTEVSASVALISLAMTPNHKEVTLWIQTGRLSSDMASHAMELCRDGCRTMHKFMRESWISSSSPVVSVSNKM